VRIHPTSTIPASRMLESDAIPRRPGVSVAVDAQFFCSHRQ
jgi:hypothetical protein